MKIGDMEEELFRAGPESIIDRSREAVTAILSKYLQNKSQVEAGKDLGALASAMAAEKFEIVANAARIIARLHARGKHASKRKVVCGDYGAGRRTGSAGSRCYSVRSRLGQVAVLTVAEPS